MAKFLLITHIYPPATDGGSKVVAKIGEYLHKQGHEILVVTSDCYSSDDFVSSRHSHLSSTPGIIRLPVITIFHRPLKFLGRLFPTLKIFSKGPLFSYLPIFTILRFRPDYIIAGPLPTTIIIYSRIISFLTKVLTHHSSKLITIPCYHPQDSDFNQPLLRSSLRHSDFIVAFTHAEKKLLSRFVTCPIMVQSLGVDPEFIIPADKIVFPPHPNILFIANFSAHKRLELLLSAYFQLRSKYPQLTLTLLGQKTLYWPNILRKINSSPYPIKIVFTPTLSQIKKAIDRSTVLCLPSIHESFGLVFVESLARGKPIIGADTPQTSEVINTLRGGLLFKTDNLSDLTAQLDSLLSRPDFSKKLAQKGYHYVSQNLTWDKISKRIWQKISSSLS